MIVFKDLRTISALTNCSSKTGVAMLCLQDGVSQVDAASSWWDIRVCLLVREMLFEPSHREQMGSEIGADFTSKICRRNLTKNDEPARVASFFR